MEISQTVATVVHACWFVRHVCSSQVDSQHEVHLLHGRFQSSRQVDGAGVVHQDVDTCDDGVDDHFLSTNYRLRL